MSLIAGACSWLAQNKDNFGLLYKLERARRDVLTNTQPKTEKKSLFPDWLEDLETQKKKDFEKSIRIARQRRSAKRQNSSEFPTWREKTAKSDKKGTTTDGEEECLITYDSDPEEELNKTLTKKRRGPLIGTLQTEEAQEESSEFNVFVLFYLLRSHVTKDHLCLKNAHSVKAIYWGVEKNEIQYENHSFFNFCEPIPRTRIVCHIAWI